MDKNNPHANFSEEDTQPIRNQRDRSLDMTQPMETFANTQPIFHDDKDSCPLAESLNR